MSEPCDVIRVARGILYSNQLSKFMPKEMYTGLYGRARTNLSVIKHIQVKWSRRFERNKIVSSPSTCES